ncbi:MAG: RNA polymerase sigma factor [Rhizobiaceae bacterium]|nr:RNA polymerase sigma factor [Rhizobiaceae bacterium]
MINRAVAGDSSAFGALVERHYDFIFKVAYRWCASRSDAEDIAQEVCLRIARGIASYRGGSAFSTWLYSMTLNAVRDLKRKDLRLAARDEAYRVHALGAAAVDGELAADPADEVWNAVRRLPPKQRDAVLLVYGEELSHARAAEVMGISETTVSWHIHEAKKRLKLLMREAGEARP